MKFKFLKKTVKKSSVILFSILLSQSMCIGSYAGSISNTRDNYDNIEPITSEDALAIHGGKITLENGKADSLLIKSPVLNPDDDSDGDGLKNNEELFTITKNNKKYLYYKSHPLLKDTDGDGISDNSDSDPLKWDVHTRDAILFQELSYRDDDYATRVLDDTQSSVVNYKNRNEYTLMHNELAPYWTLEKTWHLDNGFDASLFKFSNKRLPFLKDGEVHVLAIRGTSGPGDTNADTALSTGLWPKQATSAIDLADEINNAGYKNVYVTGHSLGGYLSQMFFVKSVGEKFGRPEANPWHKDLNYRDRNKHNNNNVKGLFTFNAPKIKHNLFTPWSGEYADLGDVLTSAYNSKHYTVDNDSVTRLTGAFYGYINLPASENGHSSRSFFEDRYISVDGFSVGERRGLSGYGYQDDNLRDLFFVEPTTVEFRDGPKVLKTSIFAERYKYILNGYNLEKYLPEGYEIENKNPNNYYNLQIGKINIVQVKKAENRPSDDSSVVNSNADNNLDEEDVYVDPDSKYDYTQEESINDMIVGNTQEEILENVKKHIPQSNQNNNGNQASIAEQIDNAFALTFRR